MGENEHTHSSAPQTTCIAPATKGRGKQVSCEVQNEASHEKCCYHVFWVHSLITQPQTAQVGRSEAPGHQAAVAQQVPGHMPQHGHGVEEVPKAGVEDLGSEKQEREREREREANKRNKQD